MDFFYNFFLETFNEINAYLKRDFSNIQTQAMGTTNINFCLFSCQKIFDIFVDVLINKAKFTGEIMIKDTLIFGKNNKFLTKNIISNNIEFKKEKIIITNDGTLKYNINYKKNNDRLEKKLQTKRQEGKERIYIFPIDGLISFSHGIDDFAVVVVLEKQNDNGEYETEKIFTCNPFSQNIFTFSKDGFYVNNKKVGQNEIYQQPIEAVFVNNWNEGCYFDLNKVAQNSYFFFTSTSIFNTICSVFFKRNVFIIYYANNDEREKKYIQFALKSCNFSTCKVGSHIIIADQNILNQIIKK